MQAILLLSKGDMYSTMLRGLVRFEWRYHTRSVTFAAACLLVALLALQLVASGYGPANVAVNAPYVVMQSMGLLSLLAIFVLTVFCAAAVLRDAEHKMAEIVFATAVDKFRYLGSHLAGVLMACLAVLSVAALTLMLAPHVVAIEPARMGATRLIAYGWAMLVMVIPNVVFAGSVVFAVAALTRSVLATYLGALFLYGLYFVTALLTDSPLMAGTAPPTPEGLARAALLDPFGLSAFFEQTRYWTPSERSTRLVALEGRFLINRLLWMGAATLVLGVVYHGFALRLGEAPRARRRALWNRPVPASASPSASVAVRYLPLAPRRSRGLSWAALWIATRMEMRHVLRSWSFAALMGMWVLVAGMDVFTGATSAEYGTQLYPTSGLLAGSLRTPLTLIGLLTLVFYSAEIVWRERAVRVDEIVDATPTSSAALYLSKAGALALIPSVMIAVGIVLSLVYQIVRGYPHLQMGPYLLLFYHAGLPLLLFGIAAVLAQCLAPNRYVGMLIAFTLAIITYSGPMVGLHHHLLRFASGPVPPLSEMTAFAQQSRSYAWFMLYWSAFAGLLAVVTWGVWRRGRSASVRARLASMPVTWGRTGRLSAAACMLTMGGAGGYIYYNTNLSGVYLTAEERDNWREAYERAYRRLAFTSQPGVIAVRADVDLFPEALRYTAAGTMTLGNRSQAAIDTVWVADPVVSRYGREPGASAAVTVEGAARVLDDRRFGLRAFRMNRPLLPGGRTVVTFRTSVAFHGLKTGDFDHSVSENGSFLVNAEVFPGIGYQSEYELRDLAERRRRNLSGTALLAGSEATPDGDGTPPGGIQDTSSTAAHRPSAWGDAWLTLETTVSTSAGQTALAPGTLRRQWRRDGRNYFEYATPRPITPRYAYVSGRFARRSVRHRGIDVELYYHPTHDMNAGRLMQAATRSLDYLTANLGPYPAGELRLVEMPSTSPFAALALPGFIYFAEDRGLLTDQRDGQRFDLVTRRMGHEVSHHWWGHQMEPAAGAGSALLGESLAKHVEQRVLEIAYGPEYLRQLRSVDEDRYLAGRTGAEADEVPLVRVGLEEYLYYGKGGVVMAGLHGLLGEAAMNRALRRLLRVGTYPNHATAADFIGALKAEAPENTHRLIDEWLTDVVLYDLSVESATYRALPDGRYAVTARIGGSKFRARGGRDQVVSMDEHVDVAVFSRHPDQPGTRATTLVTRMQRLRSGMIDVTFTVDEKPEFVAVDPFVRRIDRARSNNLRALLQAP